MRPGLRALTDVLSALAMVVWIGGHAALGAFAARIAFEELPRALAAQTMARVFHEFDRVIAVAITVLFVSAVLGVWVRGAAFLRAARRGVPPGGGVQAASQVRLGLEVGLCALGVFELLHVHAQIAALFAAGRTQELAFGVLHRLSERCAHAEVLLVVLALTARAWPERATVSSS